MPFWYVARQGQRQSIDLVFRGTKLMSDVLADLSIAPRLWTARDGTTRAYHGGFVTKLENSRPLINYLRSPQFQPYLTWPLSVIGHSLGGGLALIAVDGGFVPEAHTGPKRITMFGSPMACFHTAPIMNAEVTLVMNGQDFVPRLLGSGNEAALVTLELPLRSQFNEDFTDEEWEALWEDLLGYSSRYVHPDGLRLVVLRDGRAQEIPVELLAEQHFRIEAVAEDIANCVSHHYMTNYRASLARALDRPL